MLRSNSNEIRKKVRKLVRKHRTSDPFELCEIMCDIFEAVDFGKSETAVKGMTFVNRQIVLIKYNENLSRILLYFIVAHELGHVVLHKGYQESYTDNVFFNDAVDMELEANMFAAELLLGDSKELYEEMRDCDMTMFQLAAKHKVPYELLAYKLMIMEDEGYDVPELPYAPDAGFLSGNLGLEDCYSYYGE